MRFYTTIHTIYNQKKPTLTLTGSLLPYWTISSSCSDRLYFSFVASPPLR